MKRQMIRSSPSEVISLLVRAMVVIVACSIVSPTGAQEEEAFTAGELFRANTLVLPFKEQNFERDVLQRDWDFTAQDRGNFTFFSGGAKDLQVTGDGVLKFRMDADKVTLGWGNYQGKQPLKERINLWGRRGGFQVEIQARQSVDQKSKWTMHFWCDGSEEQSGAPYPSVSLEGKDWQELEFARKTGGGRLMACPDGFELEIEAAQGTEIEIKSLDITRQVYEGYCRREFEIPSGEIWQAMATIGNQAILYINGKEVPSKTAIDPRPTYGGASMYWTRSVDLKPYLKPGRNCIGISGFHPSDYHSPPPNLYLQCQVVTRSGEMVRVDSDETWKWSPEYSPGWSKAGFDESGWKAVSPEKERGPGNAFAQRFWYFKIKKPNDRPAYDGYLVLENPYEAKLFYSDAKPVVIQVRIPDGLAQRNPVLEWAICQFQEGAQKEIKSGKEQKPAKKGDSLIYQVSADRLPRGVYTLHTSLTSGNELIEERIPEPFVVVGRIPMKEVAGDTYEQGMDLTLEDEIDFTDPKDPHPWLETDVAQAVNEPIIVERNGLKYRETRPVYSAQYSYNVKFQHPGDFYLMVLEYPDDQERWMGASCTPEWFGVGSNELGYPYAKCGPAVFTGGKYPVSNTMRQMKWIYLPEPGYHAINVMSIQKGVAGAAAGLKIYHIANGLPALKITDPQRRWLGSITENCQQWGQSWGRTFAVLPGPVGDLISYQRSRRGKPDKKPVEEACRELQLWLDNSEDYAQYLRFTGENLSVMGSYQYSCGRALWAPEEAAISRISGCLIDVAVRVFRENGIDVLANIEFSHHSTFVQSPKSKVSHGQMQLGADTIRRVTQDGNQVGLGGRAYSGGWNFLHPFVEEKMVGVAEYFAERFKDQPNFLGVNWTTFFGGEWIPAYRISNRDQEPLGNTYDDATIHRFEKDTGTKMPVSADDPQRFQKRYLFLTSPRMKERWIQWRCEKTKQFFDQVVQRIRKQRRDLQCVVNFFFYQPHTAEWIKSGLSLRQYQRQWGWDPKLFHNNKDLWFAHMVHATCHYMPAQRRRGYAVCWEQNVSKEFYDLYDLPTNRTVMILHQFIEIESVAFKLPEKEHWARPFQSTMQAHATADYGREPFTQGLIGADPEMVIFGESHASMMIGNEQAYREFARVLRSLPKERFSPVGDTGFETNLAIRDLRKGASYYFYVANPGYWPIRGSVALSGAGRVVDLAVNRAIETKQEGGKTVVAVELKPYGVAGYRVDGGRAKVVSWKTEPVGEKDLAHMQALLKRAETLLKDPKSVVALLSEEKAFLKKSVAQAEADLTAGEYAKAWAIVTNWRFWILLHEQLEIASQYTARFPNEGKPLDPMVPRVLQVAWAKQPPKIDGKLDDSVWQGAKPVTGFLTKDKQPSLVSTRMRMAYDAKNLYVAVDCADPEPSSVQQAAKSEMDIWRSGDDSLGMFLQPDPERPTYYQLAFNPGGLKFDQKVVGGGKDYAFAPPWEVGTSVAKDRWIAEIIIPLSSLSATAGPGKGWRANFFRQFRGDLVPVSYWSWAPGSVHDTSRFGELRFLSPG